MSVGVVFPPADGVELLPAYARAAETVGLDEVWLWEDCFADGGFVAATAALAATSRITVATGILPVPLRSSAVLAMEAAALARLAPGRLVLGIGHGVQEWMRQAGVRAESPLTLLREYAVAVRALLAGERVSRAGRYVRLDGVALDRPPVVPPEVWVAGEGPKTLAVAGEVGDGIVLTAGTSPERAARALERAAAGRVAGAPPAAVFVMTAFTAAGDSDSAARARLDDAADALGLAPDARSGVIGAPAEVAVRLGAWIDAGVTRVVLLPLDGADRGAFLRDAGTVATLLRDAHAPAG